MKASHFFTCFKYEPSHKTVLHARILERDVGTSSRPVDRSTKAYSCHRFLTPLLRAELNDEIGVATGATSRESFISFFGIFSVASTCMAWTSVLTSSFRSLQTYFSLESLRQLVDRALKSTGCAMSRGDILSHANLSNARRNRENEYIE